MRLSQFLAAAAAVSLAASPAVSASANPAAKLSLASQTAAGTAPAEAPRRSSTSYMLAGVGVLVVVLAALAMGGDGDSKPASA